MNRSAGASVASLVILAGLATPLAGRAQTSPPPVVATPAPSPPAAPAAAALPFAPPAGFGTFPVALLPTTALAWRDGRSAFSINRLPDGISLPVAQLAQTLAAQTAELGTIAVTDDVRVCGEPAKRIVVENAESDVEITEQVQTVGGASFILTYTRPRGGTADPAIAGVLASYCGTGPPPALPPGWQPSDFRILGIWLGAGGESVTAIASNPEPAAMTNAKDVVKTAIKISTVTITAQRTGTLCGFPATFFSATATPATLAPIDVEFEYTQSRTAAYTLIYSRPASMAADPAATASLATLCAAPVQST